jgi:hypothetical protein
MYRTLRYTFGGDIYVRVTTTAAHATTKVGSAPKEKNGAYAHSGDHYRGRHRPRHGHRHSSQQVTHDSPTPPTSMIGGF